MRATMKERAEIMRKRKATPLLRNAIDIHCHAYPTISFDMTNRVEDAETLRQARDVGMRAIVLKSHTWPTTAHVYYLRQLVPGIEVYPSITLDIAVGGPSVWAVEAAAQQGARVVWMPTWSSAHDVACGAFSGLMQGWFPSVASRLGKGLTVLDSSGQLLPEIRDIIKLTKELGLVLSTGHLAPVESLAIAAETERIGFSRLVFGHPVVSSVGATLGEIKEMAERGAYIELAALAAVGHGKMDQTIQIIDEVGPKRCILTTDSFEDWPAPPPEFMRLFIGLLMQIGTINEEAIKIMVVQNPAKLLGLPPIKDPPSP